MPIVARPCLAAPAAVVVAKYARVSTLDQLDGFGLEDQDKVSNGWLDRHPEVTLYDSYVDEAVSGALESRPEMNRLVAHAHQQRFNRILVPKVDRIGRTARAAYQWAWNMADIGIHFISVTEGIDTSTEEGWQQFMRYVTFSEMDWRRIKERTAAGRELKISYGGWPGGSAPYGYRIEKDTKEVDGRRKRLSVLVTDAHESMVLAVAAELVVDQGMNLTEACEELNNRKLFTRSGVAWSVGNLRNRLHSETIHDGYVAYRRTDRGDGRNTTLRCDDGTPVHGDQVRIGVPPILSVERAAQLMAALKKLGFQNGRRGNGVSPSQDGFTARAARCTREPAGIPAAGTAARESSRSPRAANPNSRPTTSKAPSGRSWPGSSTPKGIHGTWLPNGWAASPETRRSTRSASPSSRPESPNRST